MLTKGAKLDKVYGSYSGSAILDNGKVITFSNMTGFAEEVYIR